MISDEEIQKFQTLWKNRFGKEIGREEAYKKGVELIRLMELIYKPMTEEEYQQLQRKKNKWRSQSQKLRSVLDGIIAQLIFAPLIQMQL